MGTKKDNRGRKLRNRSKALSGRGDQTWIDRECAECHFKDVRLQKRLGMLLEQMSAGVGESISFCLPGLDEHQGGIPVLFQRACE
jgi:Transposase DNA-binding